MRLSVLVHRLRVTEAAFVGSKYIEQSTLVNQTILRPGVLFPWKDRVVGIHVEIQMIFNVLFGRMVRRIAI